MTLTDDQPTADAWDACCNTLNRSPIDRFEAAVTLEAHIGFPAGEALEMSRRFAEQRRFAGRAAPHVAPGSSPGLSHNDAALAVGTLSDATIDDRKSIRADRMRVFGEVVFMVSVLTIGFWVSSLANELGIQRVDHAWRVALPVSLGAQWFFRRRYLSGEEGLGRLRRELPIAGVVLATVAVLGAIGGGWLGAVLALLWSSGFLIARRGWWLPQFAVLVALIVAHHFGIASDVLLVGGATLAVVASIVAVATSVATVRSASPWHAGLIAACVGGGLGALLVVEPEFVWSVRVPLPILTVIPSLLGSFWGAAHMSSLWDVLPAKLRASSLSSSSGSAASRVVRHLVLASVARIVALTLVGSTVVLWWAGQKQHLSFGDTTKRLLFAHAVLAVAGLCVSLLEGFGRSGQALFCVSLGLVSALFGAQWNLATFPPASRIVLAAVVTTVSSMAFLMTHVHEPARSIAAGV